MDKYLDDRNVIDRLIQEWETYGKIIIGVDYDNTLYDYHSQGDTYEDVANLLRECKKIGAYIIIFTCCDDSKVALMKQYLQENNIPYDKINENMEFADFGGRKIYYNILMDDRAGLKSAYHYLSIAVEHMKNKQ